jgi:hypothetical protein
MMIPAYPISLAVLAWIALRWYNAERRNSALAQALADLKGMLDNEELNADFLRSDADVLRTSLEAMTKNRDDWVDYATNKLEPRYFEAAFLCGRDGASSTVRGAELDILRPQIKALLALLHSTEDEKRRMEVLHEIIRLVSKFPLERPARPSSG